MARRRAWVLNLDADDELASPARYNPARTVLERLVPLAARVGPLVADGDILLPSPGLPPAARDAARGLAGRAWCPTPRALRTLRDAGAAPHESPALEVLRTVNHRAFNASLGQTLPGARFVTTRAELDAAIAGMSPTGDWLLKRAFGFAGRGRRKVHEGALESPDVPWVEASLACGYGLQAEPWVERTRAGDFALHGFVHANGALVLGEPTVQSIDASGAWISTARAAANDLSAAERRALERAATEAAAALAAAGYFGPFGIDAFRWRDSRGATQFNPRCEVNARYSMGWAVGLGSLRPDLE